MPIHQGHIEFEFKIREGAQAANNGVGLLLDGEIHQEPGERRDLDVGMLGDVGLDQLDPFLG